jgi:hypothetical protein
MKSAIIKSFIESLLKLDKIENKKEFVFKL